MLNTTSLSPHAVPLLGIRRTANRRSGIQQMAEALALVGAVAQLERRTVHTGDVLYQAGERFDHLYILNAGFAKVVTTAADGREQVVGLKFKGDWLGLDGIAEGCYSCDAVAMDTGEVWSLRYDALIAACASQPELLTSFHVAMSRESARERDSLMSVCTLPADARVADFLRHWAESLADRGLRTDQISLRMTRAEIGNYLGMTLETVSRALTKLARADVIVFSEKGRRDVSIPDVSALASFVQHRISPTAAAMH